MSRYAVASGLRPTPSCSHSLTLRTENACAKLPGMARPKYTPGQRVRINEGASELVPGYVGMVGHIGIGSVNAPSFQQGEYFVTVRLETGAKVILRLTEKCLDQAPAEFRL